MTVLLQCLALQQQCWCQRRCNAQVLPQFIWGISTESFTAWLTTKAVLKEGRTEGGLSSTIARKICRIIIKTILQTYISHWSHLAWSKGHWILDLDQYADAFVQIPRRIKCWLSLLAEDLAIGRSSVQTLSPCVAVPRDPNSQGLNPDPTSSCFYCRIIWLSISTALVSNSQKAWSSWSKMLKRGSPCCFDSQLLSNRRGSTGKVVGGSVTHQAKTWTVDNFYFIMLLFCTVFNIVRVLFELQPINET